MRLLVAPHTTAILIVLAERRLGRAKLREQLGNPPSRTLQERIEELGEINALRHSGAGYELTEAGRELAKLTVRLANLLQRAPNGPLEIDSDEARALVDVLVGPAS